MRAGFVRVIGLGLVALGAVVAGACNDDPLSFDVKDATQLRSNPSLMLIPAGRTGDLTVIALNDGAEPTFDAIQADVGGCGGTGGAISVAENPLDTDVTIVAPGSFLVTAGNTLGSNCVVSSGAGLTDTTEVVVVADAVEFVSAPASLKLPDSGLVEVRTIAFDSTEATPYQTADFGFSVDTTTILSVDDVGAIETVTTSGTATVTATWLGNIADATATEDQFGRRIPYVTRSASVSINVLPGLPDTAFAAVLNQEGGVNELTGISSVAITTGNTEDVEIWVLDAFVADRDDGLGNKNTLPEDVLDVTAVSDNPAVATVNAEVRDAVVAGVTVRTLVVQITGVSVGTATVSGTVETSAGVLTYPDIDVTVLDAFSIASISPESGFTGDVITITGTNLVQAGPASTLTIDGSPIWPNLIDSFTADQIVFRAPNPGVAREYEFAVQIGPVPSNAVGWTLESLSDRTEPADNSGATAPVVTFPIEVVGSWDVEVPQGFGAVDLFKFTLAAPGTVNFVLDWVDANRDVDVYIWDLSVAPEPSLGFGGFPAGWACGAEGGSGGAGFHPEVVTDCALAAGDYLVWLYDFGTAEPPIETTYRVSGTLTP